MASPLALIQKLSNTSFLLHLVYRAFGKYKKRIFLLVVLGFVASFFEAIGITSIIPLFSILIGSSLVDSRISVFVKEAFEFLHIPFSLKFILIFIVVLFLLRGIVLLLSNYIRVKITAEYEQETRASLFKKAMQADWAYLLKQKLGHLETVLLTNISYGESMLNTITNIVSLATGLIIYLIAALNISLQITIFTTLLGALLILVLRPFSFRARALAKETEEINRQASYYVNENILGMKTVKSMAVDSEVVKNARGYFQTLKNAKVSMGFLRLLPSTLMQPVGLIFVVSIFAFSYKSAGFNLAAFAAIVYLIQRIFLYAEQLQTHIYVFNQAVPYVEEVLKNEKLSMQSAEVVSGVKSFAFNKEISFKNISFCYEGTDEDVLRNVTLTIKKGNILGIIGQSGAGKTTVVDLLLRLFRPTGGGIFVDGVNAEDIGLSEWRKNIGYVAQDFFLINDTIENNIRFYDESMTTQTIERAAKMANIYDFISNLPDGFRTRVGERGVMLSGGQRQRVAIARALARKPSVLILDEATSALDSESEEQIQKVIERLRGDLTVVVIAHRLSTIINSDYVLAIDKGKLVEEGHPIDLLKNPNSYFSRVYNG